MAARGVLAIQTTGRTQALSAITFTAANATNKHVFDNRSKGKLLIIKNLHSASHIVTIKRPATVDGATLGDLTITVVADGVAVVGPFSNGLYGQADTDSGITDGVFIDPPATPTELYFAVIQMGTD